MMRSTSGIVFCSLLFTVGTLVFLLDSSSPRRLTLRHTPSKRRFLYNYSRNKSSSSSSSSYNSYGSNNYSNNYASSSSSGNGDDSTSGSSSSSSGSSSSSSYNYGSDSASNNAANYDNQNYDNSNYIWQNDDMDYSADDDGSSYYSSNKNYQASGSNYNGRGQWGGQSVQRNDDAVPEVTVYGNEDTDHWSVFSKLGSLSAKETAALSILLALLALCLLFLLGCGCNIVDICQLYCCCGIFRHKDVNTASDPVVDGFVKLGDY